MSRLVLKEGRIRIAFHAPCVEETRIWKVFKEMVERLPEDISNRVVNKWVRNRMQHEFFLKEGDPDRLGEEIAELIVEFRKKHVGNEREH